MKQPILIFGGSGFIGQALCKEAIQRNIPVISISKHGKPKGHDLWMTHPLLTWVTMDIFRESEWRDYVKNCRCCINLIGILFEQPKKGLTYDKMIVQSNRLIAQEAEQHRKNYLFLSAKGGPSGYVRVKKQAEEEVMTLTTTTIIIRSGLVVTKRQPMTYLQGVGIKGLTHCPLLKKQANKVYPTPLKVLVSCILNTMEQPTSLLVSDIR